MAHILTHDAWPPAAASRQSDVRDDPLDAARGIIVGVLISILGFWLPLAIALMR